VARVDNIVGLFPRVRSKENVRGTAVAAGSLRATCRVVAVSIPFFFDAKTCERLEAYIYKLIIYNKTAYFSCGRLVTEIKFCLTFFRLARICANGVTINSS
jgi:hypothetical protein